MKDKHSYVLAGIILAVAIIRILLNIRAGFREDGYLVHVLKETGPFPYPTGGVFNFCAFVVFESVVLFLIMHPMFIPYLWVRAGCAAFVFSIWTVFLGYFAMHSPPYYAAHVVGLFWVSVTMMAIFFGSALHAFWRRIRRERVAKTLSI